MKQSITIEDLNQLSDEQKERLREWWKPVVGNEFTEFIKVGSFEGDNDYVISDLSSFMTSAENKDRIFVPLLSVGQMIEFIVTKSNSIYIPVNLINGEPRMRITESKSLGEKDHADVCDTLWGVVKIILNKPLG